MRVALDGFALFHRCTLVRGIGHDKAAAGRAGLDCPSEGDNQGSESDRAALPLKHSRVGGSVLGEIIFACTNFSW